jgi:hypothetical protein
VLSTDGASELVKNTTRTVSEASTTVKGLTGLDVPALIARALADSSGDAAAASSPTGGAPGSGGRPGRGKRTEPRSAPTTAAGGARGSGPVEQAQAAMERASETIQRASATKPAALDIPPLPDLPGSAGNDPERSN